MRRLGIFIVFLSLIACGEDNAQNNMGKAPVIKKVSGCGDSVFQETDPDPSKKGTWAVGAKTLKMEDSLLEVWYPARPGAEKGKTKVIYDIRKQLAPKEGKKIPDNENPWNPCDCYRDLELDQEHGPYPLMVFVHGTAAFRHQSVSLMTHWASRGFIVAAMDHPGLRLGDMLSFKLFRDTNSDLEKMMGLLLGLDEQEGEFKGKIDFDQMAASGHSAGGGAINFFKDKAKVMVSMASGGVEEGSNLKASLIFGGTDDKVVNYSSQQKGYEKTKGQKYLVGIADSGHLAFSDLCLLGKEHGGLVEIAKRHKVSNSSFADALWDGCGPESLDPKVSMEITAFATSAVLEEHLMCKKGFSKSMDSLKEKYQEVQEFKSVK